ncbi:MAG TPA: HAD family hydrolase [Desulfuromonadales bacterium]|nr:HAD family hydrolase [Desulfuromonadales bacterium]
MNCVEDLSLDQIEVVLFDLDGTLLGVDMHRFIPTYLDGLAARLEDWAHSREIVDSMRQAVVDMLSRVDDRMTLEQRLLARLQNSLAIPPSSYQQALVAFCRETLPDLQSFVQAHPLARPLLRTCRQRGWRMVLATNPIFPRMVIDARMQWAGLEDDFFQFVTDYETFRHCKPHVEYFQEVLARLQVPAEACLMVGNDSWHDMAACRAGIRTCLLTTWRIDHRDTRYPPDWEGTHEEFLELL